MPPRICSGSWPEGSPEDFDRAFDAARLYLDFRWLGEEPAQLMNPSRAGSSTT